MSAIAILPASILHIAAQFASTDSYKESLVNINVKRIKEEIIIHSTDGHRAFRFRFEMNENYHMDEEELNLSASTFKKRVAKAEYVRIEEDMAIFLNDLKKPIVGHPYEKYDGTFPNMEQIWPSQYTNQPNGPIAFNAQLLSEFLQEVTRYSWNGTTLMVTNQPSHPMQFSSRIFLGSIESELEFLLMPVQIRS